MKSIAYQTADLIVIHLQAVPPEHYLAKRRLHPLHRLKVPLSPPPARPGAGLPEIVYALDQQPTPTSQRFGTTFTPRPSRLRNDLTIHTHQYVHHLLVILKKQYAEIDHALKQERAILMPQLLFQDRSDMKRVSVGLLTHYLVDLRRTLDAKP